MSFLYIFLVIVVGVICWRIIYEELFKEDEDELEAAGDYVTTINAYIEELNKQPIKPWVDQLDEQFKKWEMKK